jgi:hypothetical protein
MKLGIEKVTAQIIKKIWNLTEYANLVVLGANTSCFTLLYINMAMKRSSGTNLDSV